MLQEDVKKAYDALKRLYDSDRSAARIDRDVIFQEWANGKILLDSEATSKAVTSAAHGSYGHLVRLVNIELLDQSEVRLKTALFDEESENKFVVRLMLPT